MVVAKAPTATETDRILVIGDFCLGCAESLARRYGIYRKHNPEWLRIRAAAAAAEPETVALVEHVADPNVCKCGHVRQVHTFGHFGAAGGCNGCETCRGFDAES